jgi:hypothetical protein
VTRREWVAAEIERRIAQRDRLWAHVQGARRGAGLDVVEETIAAAANQRLASRVETLEEGLARYLDPEWVATATPAELTAHARDVLRRRPATPDLDAPVAAPADGPVSAIRPPDSASPARRGAPRT